MPFRLPPPLTATPPDGLCFSRRLVIEARAVLTQWSENYFRMRKRLEDTNDQRWEFDRKVRRLPYLFRHLAVTP